MLGSVLASVLLLSCSGGIFPSTDAVYAEAFARFDTDGDGVLTEPEYVKFDPIPGTFAEMDRSRNQKVDADEFKYFVLSHQPRALVSRKGGPR